MDKHLHLLHKLSWRKKLQVVLKGIAHGRGLPQGSVLGSHLFIVFVNNLLSSVTDEVNLYTDDTSVLKKEQILDLSKTT